MRGRTIICSAVFISLSTAYAAIQPISKIPVKARVPLTKRLREFVTVNRSRDWAGLYRLVSDTGRGRISKQRFIDAMEAGHGRSFASEPDLLEFHEASAERVGKNEYDIYGCARTQREGEEYNGVAVVHAGFEHGDWLFSGWTFVVPNEVCEVLSDPQWEPMSRLKWKLPLEELRSLRGN